MTLTNNNKYLLFHIRQWKIKLRIQQKLELSGLCKFFVIFIFSKIDKGTIKNGKFQARIILFIGVKEDQNNQKKKAGFQK